MSELVSLGVPEALAARASAYLGDNAAALLRGDPWELLRVPGVQPEQADHLAKSLLPEADPQDPRRGRALVEFLLGNAAREGHTSLPGADVVGALKQRRIADPVAAVNAAINDSRVMLFLKDPDIPEDSDDFPDPEEWLALSRYGDAEQAVADGVQRLAAASPIENELTGEAAQQALFHGVSIAVGPAEPIVAELLTMELKTAVTAVTATAAQEFPGGVSLHRLLEARENLGALEYARGEQRPLEADLVIVAGAEALDAELAAALLRACPDGAHLLLIGDPDGLGSFRPGQVLADLIESDTIPLTYCPPVDSPLGELIENAREGELAEVDAPGREVVVVPVADGREAAHRVGQLVADSIPRALGIAAADIQILTPGLAGTAALNGALKTRFNPGPGACGGFDVGDRVLVAAPLADAPAGETGTVTGTGDGILTVEFPDGSVKVPAAHFPRLRHGWAIPVQQAVGSRWPAVVAVFPGADGLTRPLALTAFSRARRHLSIVTAAGPALAQSVAEKTVPSRRTRLSSLLQ